MSQSELDRVLEIEAQLTESIDLRKEKGESLDWDLEMLMVEDEIFQRTGFDRESVDAALYQYCGVDSVKWNRISNQDN